MDPIRNLVIVCLLFVSPVLASAQEAGDRGRWWLGLGIGGGTTPDETQITSTLLQATYQKAGHQVSARFPFLFIGVGVQAFANLNRTGTYTGVVLFLQAGRLR